MREVQPQGLTHDHLRAHRELIWARSLAAGLCGLVPVPILDEWLASAIRRSTLRSLANLWQVDVDEAAVTAIADAADAPPTWRAVLGSTAIGFLLKRTLRKALLVLLLGQRVRDISRTFAVMTLFDHYCARLHVGPGLDRETGRALRQHIDQAIAETRLGLFSRMVRHTLIHAPRGLVHVLSSGALARILSGRDEAVAAEILDESVKRATGGALGRLARMLEEQVTRAGQAYLTELLLAFHKARRPS